MSHGITKSDRMGYVPEYAGEKMWHFLGDPIEAGLNAQQAFQNMGLGWATELTPVFALINGIYQPVPEYRAHVRGDTGDLLGMVTDGYRAFENQDVARFTDELAGQDKAVKVQTLASLYGGKRIFVSVKLPGDIVLGKDDVTGKYLVISNGHGGFAGFNVYLTAIRPVCDNTLRMSERDLASGIRFRHTGNLQEKVAQARLALGIAMEEGERFEQKIRALAATSLSPGQVKAFMELTWDQTFGKLDPEAMEPESYEKLVAKRKLTIDTWLENMENERNTLVGIKGTAWAALNAVTEWHDHQRGRFQNVRVSGARVHSNLFGISNQHKTRAFATALQLVK